MDKNQEKRISPKKSKYYFNFNKFERLLDNLLSRAVEVTAEDFKIENLKTFKEFSYFFDTFSSQEIKTHLLFYQYQLKDLQDT